MVVCMNKRDLPSLTVTVAVVESDSPSESVTVNLHNIKHLQEFSRYHYNYSDNEFPLGCKNVSLYYRQHFYSRLLSTDHPTVQSK